jgi:hypothetical protein
MGRRGGKGRRRRRKGADRSNLGSGVERGDVAGKDKELCRAFGRNPRPLS